MARQEGLERYKTVEFWYRWKYNLPATDPRFLDTTTEEMMTDYFAHTFKEDPKRAEDEVVDEDFDDLDVAAELGRPSPGPVVIDDFEKLD